MYSVVTFTFFSFVFYCFLFLTIKWKFHFIADSYIDHMQDINKGYFVSFNSLFENVFNPKIRLRIWLIVDAKIG